MRRICLLIPAIAVAVSTFVNWIYIARVSVITPTPDSMRHCHYGKKTTQTLVMPQTPPWSSNSTIRWRNTLYVWPNQGKYQRLGNRLFNYASTFGIAWRNRHHPIFPDTNDTFKQYDLSDFFNIRIPIDHGNKITENVESRALKMKELGSALYDKRFEQLPERNVSLQNYLQSFKYFQDVEDQLRIDLAFKPSVLDTARRWLHIHTPEKWKLQEFVRVVVHVRRTDYTRPYYKRDGWLLPTADYFQRSLSYFTDCLERVQFVVLSDDQAWCRKNLNASNIVYSVGNSPIVDMAIASLCDHAIITIGSFGWWTAWFANGITVTQKNMPPNNTRLAKRMNRKDYYKPEWLAL